MELLNVHFKSVHNESQNDKITRVTATIEKSNSSKITTKLPIFDCSECGVIFQTSKEQNDHIRTQIFRKVILYASYVTGLSHPEGKVQS